MLASIFGVVLLNHFGRKTLTIFSQIVVVVSLIGMFIFQELAYNLTVLIIVVVVFIFGFECGLGPVCFVYIAETNNNIGISINSVVAWFWNLIISIGTPPLTSALGGWQWLIYSSITFVGLVYFAIEMKETRNVPQDQVQYLYEKRIDEDSKTGILSNEKY